MGENTQGFLKLFRKTLINKMLKSGGDGGILLSNALEKHHLLYASFRNLKAY